MLIAYTTNFLQKAQIHDSLTHQCWEQFEKIILLVGFGKIGSTLVNALIVVTTISGFWCLAELDPRLQRRAGGRGRSRYSKTFLGNH